ncbi:MAG TPA: NFACT family protein, partial [Ignavibacteria bacterium]
MLNNYYILKELANHLDKELSYFKISGCFSQEKDQLVISFSKDGNTKYLLFSCIRNNSSLLLRDNYSKAKQNTATLFQSLKEISVSKIFIDISDRLIYFKTENNLNLICSFASGKENFFITDNNIILESFKENSALKGTSLNNHFLFQPATIPESGTVKEYFKNKYIRFGKSYFKEILFRLKITPETVLNDTLKSNVDAEFQTLLDRFCTPEFIIYTNQNDMIMSLTRLEYYENSYKKIQFENIIDLISEFYKRKQKQKFLTNTKNKKLTELESKLRKIDSKINNLTVRYNESL